VGLQLGDPQRPGGRVAVAHEVTAALLAEAVDAGAQVIVTYHPLVFRPLSTVTAEPGAEGRVLALIEAGIAVIAMHTNWDAAPGGTADALADAVDLEDVEPFPVESAPVGPDSMGHAVPVGRIGRFAGSADELRATIARSLSADARVAGLGTSCRRIATVPGSGGSFVDAAIAAGAEVLITGDVSHHQARRATDHGMAIVDAGHAATERAGVRALYAAVGEIAAEPIDLTHVDVSPWEHR